MPLRIVRNDITKMQVHASVNAANTALRMGGGYAVRFFRPPGLMNCRWNATALEAVRLGKPSSPADIACRPST